MYQIVPSHFDSKQYSLDARLYLPDASAKVPVIVMAHGFGALMDWGLHPFADAFARMGCAVVMFDYRGFGKSEGEIQRLVYHVHHIEDYHSAIAYARTIPSIDTSKIFLWGTSYSGGHVLTVASQDTTIAGAIAQVPFVDGLATAFNLPLKNIFWGIWYGMLDMVMALVGAPPVTIPMVATPDSFAAMNTPECYEGYMKLVPPEARDENWCPARVCLTLPFYRPISSVDRISCPVCIIGAKNDSLIPIKAVEKTAKKIKNVDFHVLPCGHFDPYGGDMFERNIEIQKRFLKYLLKI
ncbi:MAG: alpha/beta fold hydrolase [Spirochaetes bacterium]|nr:alpha/beta fold hydrolase [Spirochaetota bacterium]